jgi:fatty acid desaturase
MHSQMPSADGRLLAQARSIVADLRAPKAWIYWADLLVTAAVLWSAILWGAASGRAPVAVGFAAIVASLALTRGSMFLHELAHVRESAVPGFRIAWNLFVGIPFGIPSFLWETSHRDHHQPAVYRTERDPEHPPDRRAALARVGGALVISLFAVPPALLARWLLLGPLSMLHRDLRRWVWDRASTLSLNPAYRPRRLRGRARAEMLSAETLCFAWCVALVTAVFRSSHAARAIGLGSGAIAFAAVVTTLRGELLHRFGDRYRQGTLEQQVFESVTIPHSGLLSALFLPLGIGYHALHHLDPRIPYHAMGEAHARLIARLPSASAYHRTVRRAPRWRRLHRTFA